jgi:hypothetical protein
MMSAMSLRTAPRRTPFAGSRRDPTHVVYDHACDLLAAAQGLRAAMAGDGTAPAIAATLGCLEATLEALADSVDEMREQVVDRLDTASELLPEPGVRVRPRQAAQQFDDLARILRSGRDVTGGVRSRVGPAVAALTHG